MSDEQSTIISRHVGSTLEWSIVRESDSMVASRGHKESQFPMIAIVRVPKGFSLQGAIENKDERVVDVFVRQQRTAKQSVYKLRNLPEYFLKKIHSGQAYVTQISDEGVMKDTLEVKVSA